MVRFKSTLAFVLGLTLVAGCSGIQEKPIAKPAEPAAMAAKAPAPPPEPPKPPPVTPPPPAGKPAAPKDPDLIGHWTLDEKSGEKASDSSGNDHHATLHNSASWVEGKIGGGIGLAGKDAYLEVPSAPDLDKVNQGSYTLSAWFKPADLPPGKEAENNANYGIIIKTGWHEGLHFTNEGKFVMEHWLAGTEPVWNGAGTWETAFDAGKWYHVVGVVDAAARHVMIYVNGELVNTGEEWEAGKQARDTESVTWKIGIGAPGSEQWSWPAKAVIDDVRIYKRALSAADVEKLCKESAK
jgi:hypothetical protein